MDPFDKSFVKQYELARRIGDARYGTECRHEHVKDGRCIDCQRRVCHVSHRKHVRRFLLA